MDAILSPSEDDRVEECIAFFENDNPSERQAAEDALMAWPELPWIR